MLCKMIPTFESVDEILKCDHSNESYRAVLSCGIVSFAVQDSSCIECDYSNEKLYHHYFLNVR